MTKGGRKAGGILSLIGGGLFAMWIVISLMAFFMSPPGPEQFLMLGVVLMFTMWTATGLIGGILLLKDNWLGGVFPLVSGSTLLLYFFIEFRLPDGMSMIMSGGPIDPMILVALLMCLVLVIGGILGLVFKAEEGVS